MVGWSECIYMKWFKLYFSLNQSHNFHWSIKQKAYSAKYYLQCFMYMKLLQTIGKVILYSTTRIVILLGERLVTFVAIFFTGYHVDPPQNIDYSETMLQAKNYFKLIIIGYLYFHNKGHYPTWYRTGGFRCLAVIRYHIDLVLN